MSTNNAGKKFKKGLAITLASIGVATTAVGCGNTPITLGQAVEAGVITENTKNRFDKIEEQLENSNMTDSEVASAMDEVKDLQVDTGKEKVADAIGKDEGNITFKYSHSESGGEYILIVAVDGKDTYYMEDMDSNMREAIKDMGELQTAIKNAESKGFNKNDCFKKCKSYFKRLKNFAVKRVKEEDGRLITEDISKEVTDIEKENEER